MSVLAGIKDDDLILRLSALLHDIGKIRVRTEEDGKIHFLKHELKSGEMIDELLRPLKFSNEIIKEVTFLVRNHMICKTWGYECENMKDKKLRRLQYECKTEEHFRNLMTIIDADKISSPLEMTFVSRSCKSDQLTVCPAKHLRRKRPA